MANRKPRKKLTKKNIDVFKPVDFSKLGTSEDPCFGKHWDLTAKECNNCGDSELCAIAFQQKQLITRKKIESKETFKDLQKVKLTRKELSLFLIKVLKVKNQLPIEDLKERAKTKLLINDKQFDDTLVLVLAKSKKLKKLKNSIKLI